MKNSAIIESILFHKAEPMSFKELSSTLNIPEEEVINALNELKIELEGRGIGLVLNDKEAMLRTSSEASEIIEKITKEELSRDLSKAALETLSIILYRSPVSKKDIDYIRGVKSSFILRSLMIRGLIERVPDPKDSRTHLYKPTFELLGYMGLGEVGELPDFEKANGEINDFMNSNTETENE